MSALLKVWQRKAADFGVAIEVCIELLPVRPTPLRSTDQNPREQQVKRAPWRSRL